MRTQPRPWIQPRTFPASCMPGGSARVSLIEWMGGDPFPQCLLGEVFSTCRLSHPKSTRRRLIFFSAKLGESNHLPQNMGFNESVKHMRSPWLHLPLTARDGSAAALRRPPEWGGFPNPASSLCSAESGYVLELFSLEVRGPGFRLSLTHHGGISGGSAVKNLPRDLGSIPGSGRSPGEGNGNLLEVLWTEKPGRLQSTGLQKSWTWLSD